MGNKVVDMTIVVRREVPMVQTMLENSGGSVNSTPHTSLFSRSKRALVMMCHTTFGSSVCARHPIHVLCA